MSFETLQPELSHIHGSLYLKHILEAVRLMMCLLWWSWLLREGIAPSEALLCSSSWLVKTPAVLVPDLEVSVPYPWQRTTPGNERGMPITRGCDRAGLCCAVFSHLAKLECVLYLKRLFKQVKSSAVCVNLPL